MRALAPAILLIGGSALVGCGAGDAGASAVAVRDTLPNGAVRVAYAELPAAAERLQTELSIGAIEGEPHEIFGDIRGIEADPDGNIYVLDYQASEIRAFGPDGEFLRTLTQRGEGPGELTEANGMILAEDGTLWVQDHGKWQMINLDLSGTEIQRLPMHVRSYGYIWSGTVDHRGRFWKDTSHSDEERVFPPPEGLTEGATRAYLKWFDPATEESDSIFLGDDRYRTYISQNSRGGWTYRGIPFTPSTMTIVDPAGGFWRTAGGAYRIARLDELGDTVLVIEADVPPSPATAEDRERFIAGIVERDASMRRAAEEMVALAPETHPVIDQLIVDDEGLLWVRRFGRDDELPLYDLFTREGEYVRSVALGFTPSRYLPIRIRNGRIYALVRDSLDVPHVVRAGTTPLPEM